MHIVGHIEIERYPFVVPRYCSVISYEQSINVLPNSTRMPLCCKSGRLVEGSSVLGRLATFNLPLVCSVKFQRRLTAKLNPRYFQFLLPLIFLKRGSLFMRPKYDTLVSLVSLVSLASLLLRADHSAETCCELWFAEPV